MAGRVIRLKDLITHTGLSRSAIYDRMDPKSPRHDPEFPKSFPLGGTATAWFLDDVERWLASCASRPKQKAPAKKLAGASSAKKKIQGTRTAPPQDPSVRLATSSSGLSLAEAIVSGGQLNAKLLDYLRMESWSAPAAALLVAGVTPPEPDCSQVPEGGFGLEGKSLHASNARFHLARRLLRQWQSGGEDEGDEPNPAIVEPVRFLAWCSEEAIDTEWLRLFKELIDMRDSDAIDLSAARLALAASVTKLR